MKKRRRTVRESAPPGPLDRLFPDFGKALLTGGGREFVERLGEDAIKQAVLRVMLGENLRTQTEPLSRRRIAMVSGALLAMYARGSFSIPGFEREVSRLATEQWNGSRTTDTAQLWPAQWLLGLTGKSVQNVLRSDPDALHAYVEDFEKALDDSARRCATELGELQAHLTFDMDGRTVSTDLNWHSLTRLLSAIGSQTLTIRGSDKSIYGKLFERLILGTLLTALGFTRSAPGDGLRPGSFWLSDSSDLRESDATLIVDIGMIARFDIGFIGPGNPEISKDKLSRYAREFEMAGGKGTSMTFIIVDRLPSTGRTQEAAVAVGAEIVQMSMKYWPIELAQKLKSRLGVNSKLAALSGAALESFLQRTLQTVRVADFVSGVVLEGGDQDE